MSRLAPKYWSLFVATVAGVILYQAPCRAQNSDEVQFDSVDKVALHGTFYSPGKSKAPCVIMLHKYGGNRQQNGWDKLAKILQKDFAVLSFDFRGHGDSTGVEPDFWRYPNNSLIRGAGRAPQKISFKDFPPAYAPMLANDVSAAKRYLDQQNDAGVCNSSNIIVIGADEGAAIGALWIGTEFVHYRLVRNALMRWVPDRSGGVEGDDIACAVWLSIPKTLAGQYVGNWFRGKIRDKIPMVFFFGDKDAKAASSAQALVDELKRGTKEKLEFTRTRGKDTKLSGNELLGKKALGTEDEISVYLEKVMQKRGSKAPLQRDTKNGAPLYPIPLSQFGFAGLR